MKSPSPTENALSHIARRERLAVLCAIDRAALRLILVPPVSAPAPERSPGTLSTVLNITQFFPGAIGRWSRRLAAGGGLLRRALS